MSRLLQIVLLCGWGCMASCTSKPTRTPLRLAVAANFQPTAQHLAARFSDDTGIPVEIISASSAKLALQIREGAAHHMLLSADSVHPHRLYTDGHLAAPPTLYCQGSLAMIARHELAIGELNDLAKPHVRRIAIANPSTAPYGQMAEIALHRAGLHASVVQKLVFGESISQVNLYLRNGNVDAVITAASHREDSSRFVTVALPQHSYPPITQWMGTTMAGAAENLEACKQFAAFMHTPNARQIIVSDGYLVH